MGIYNKHNWRIDIHAKFLTYVSEFARWAPCSFMPAPCGWMSALRHYIIQNGFRNYPLRSS